ncbi:LCP family protein [Nocardioides kongjuensis]|uniref:LCP family protein required for cell wall assembly n=1 Tax=Nocardioides kongjuensis TaxID=349522 RepID=A0A852RCF9_9ACTN|nr:LCP family protein [Nocardioides kongjuensis]NYD28468.1 LCP family protein required for cell wall assembly [Nocardioides kongjuensis]
MAGRGNDTGGTGGEDFDWVYGSGSQDGPRGSSDPEPTRRIPVQRRPGATPPGPPPPPVRLPPAQQYGATPEPGGPRPSARPPRRGRWTRPRTYVRLVLLVLVLWLAFLVAVPLIAWNKVDKVDFEPSADRPAEQPGTTYLLVGSDSRAGLSPKERRKLHTGDAASELTDTILLLHTGDGPTTLVSIPRDSPLEIPGFGRSKVNSAYAKGGTPLLVQTLEKATGLRVDQYVEIGFGGLVGVVDAVGGIEICPKQRIKDKDSGLNVKKGCQEVDGATALAYSRARKYSPISDLARVQQQREVIAAVGDKVLSPWSVLNPIRWWELNGAVPDFFRFGKTTGPVAAGKWALAMTKVEKSCTVPLARADTTWDTKRAQQLFGKIAADRTDEITPDLCTATGLAR